MDAFYKQAQTVKTALLSTVGIAKGEAVDTIDVDTYAGDLAKMANITFTGPQLSVSQKMTRKDAFDFISACSRSVDHFKLDRAAYYNKAISAAAVQSERVDYTMAATYLFDLVRAR